MLPPVVLFVWFLFLFFLRTNCPNLALDRGERRY